MTGLEAAIEKALSAAAAATADPDKKSD